LRSAFSMAGAESTLMTLWPVSVCSSMRFMDSFYGHLSQPPPEALRLAQQEMIASHDLSDPRYWSSYVVSMKGTLAAGRANPGPSQTSTNVPPVATGNPKQPFLVTPRCFHIVSHSDIVSAGGPHFREHYDTQIKIGGVIRRVQNSPTQVIYDLSADGNNLEMKAYIDRVQGSDQDIIASERKWLVQAIVEQLQDSSSITFRFGPNHDSPEQNRTIKLKGKANLFRSLDLPDALPPIGPEISVTDSYAVTGAVDEVSACPSEP
jgi:hypothetical protein